MSAVSMYYYQLDGAVCACNTVYRTLLFRRMDAHIVIVMVMVIFLGVDSPYLLFYCTKATDDISVKCKMAVLIQLCMQQRKNNLDTKV